MTTETIVEYPLDQFDDSPFQPRTIYDQKELEEMAATMRPPGRVHSPVVARMVNGRAESVFGHKRRRAAAIAELATVPTIFREMTDEEVKVAQIVENLQRSDVNEVDEADAMAVLRRDHGTTIEELMEKAGKSRSFVYNRMRLATAHNDVRAAVRNGSLDAEVAQEVARRPHGLQLKAMMRVAGMSFRQAKAELQRSFQFDLARAPFDVLNIKLVPDAGGCDACRKRSDYEPVLLEECGPDVCMDGECYGAKATKTRELDAAKAAKAKKGAAPQIHPAQAWPFPNRPPEHRPSASGEQATLDGVEEQPPLPIDNTLPADERAVADNWPAIRMAVLKSILTRPRTTDDLRFLLERELDYGDTDFGEAEELLGWSLGAGSQARRDKLQELTADELGTLLLLVAAEGAPWTIHTNRARDRIAFAARFGIDVMTAAPFVAAESAATPSTAARAPKKAKAAPAGKKAKRALVVGGDPGAPDDAGLMDEVSDDAGVAGGSDAEAGALEGAGA